MNKDKKGKVTTVKEFLSRKQPHPCKPPEPGLIRETLMILPGYRTPPYVHPCHVKRLTKQEP